MAEPKQVIVFVVSDGSGATAEGVATSVAVQFRGAQVDIRRFPFTRTEEQVREVLAQAPKADCIIVYTLVSQELRDLLEKEARKRNVVAVDVMGFLLGSFSTILKDEPSRKPGIFRREDDEVYPLTDAIKFTLSHDDGLGLETLDQADLVILGVSRTGKTPTSIFLSCKKLKVANIPIINQAPIPREVLRCPAKKVGFRMSVDRMFQLRSERMSGMSKGGLPSYSSRKKIMEETEYSESIFKKIPSLWTVDVTNRSIEAISEWITRNVL